MLFDEKFTVIGIVFYIMGHCILYAFNIFFLFLILTVWPWYRWAWFWVYPICDIPYFWLYEFMPLINLRCTSLFLLLFRDSMNINTWPLDMALCVPRVLLILLILFLLFRLYWIYFQGHLTFSPSSFYKACLRQLFILNTKFNNFKFLCVY